MSRIYKFAKNMRPGDYYLYGGFPYRIVDVAEVSYTDVDDNGNSYPVWKVVFLREGNGDTKVWFDHDWVVELPFKGEY